MFGPENWFPPSLLLLISLLQVLDSWFLYSVLFCKTAILPLPKKRYVQILTPVSMNVTFFERGSLQMLLSLGSQQKTIMDVPWSPNLVTVSF